MNHNIINFVLISVFLGAMYSHNCFVKFSDIMAVVIDCGTDTTRVGLSRSHGPGVIFPTIVGIPKSVSILRICFIFVVAFFIIVPDYH